MNKYLCLFALAGVISAAVTPDNEHELATRQALSFGKLKSAGVGGILSNGKAVTAPQCYMLNACYGIFLTDPTYSYLTEGYVPCQLTDLNGATPATSDVDVNMGVAVAQSTYDDNGNGNGKGKGGKGNSGNPPAVEACVRHFSKFYPEDPTKAPPSNGGVITAYRYYCWRCV